MLLLSPLYLAIAAAVKLSSPGPVFFVQTRVGRYGRYFKFYKFRSMRQDAESQKASLLARNESKDGVIFKMKDDPRITKVGRFLRRTSLDELPLTRLCVGSYGGTRWVTGARSARWPRRGPTSCSSRWAIPSRSCGWGATPTGSTCR